MGLEILLRIDPEYEWPLATVLLRCGKVMSTEDCFARLVVKARERDILSVLAAVDGFLFNA